MKIKSSIIIALILLAGCATPPPRPMPNPGLAKQQTAHNHNKAFYSSSSRPQISELYAMPGMLSVPLSIAASTSNSCTLRWWMPSAYGVTNYAIKYGTTPNVYTKTNNFGVVVDRDGTNYYATVTNLNPSQRYYLVANAQSALGTSPDSNVATYKGLVTNYVSISTIVMMATNLSGPYRDIGTTLNTTIPLTGDAPTNAFFKTRSTIKLTSE